VLYCKFFHKIKKGFVPFTVQLLLVAVLLCKSYSKAEAQECPPNIDFETGTFEGWICYIGSVSGDNAQNAINIFGYKGFTPEVGGAALTRGVDAEVYPLFATYNLGVNVTF